MGILGRLFGKKNRLAKEPGFVDLRDDKERQIERDANAGKSLGAEADLLVTELIQIGNGPGYISNSGGAEFNERGDHIRTHEIGERLNEIGGNDLMIASCYRVKAALGGGTARTLESAWGYIGTWLP